MPGQAADVLLITDEASLRDSVRASQPDDTRLECLTGAQVSTSEAVTARQVWIDLDHASGAVAPGGIRRVYFYSRPVQAADPLPAGVFIRKPGTRAVFDVLWASVQSPAALGPPHAESEQMLPGWLLDFHDLRLKPLCDKLVSQLSARLGYAACSLYLYDAGRRILTLSGTTHRHPIDLAIPVDAHNNQVMMMVARDKRVFQTEHAPLEIAARGIQPLGERPNDDGVCLVAPLLCDGELVAVINLTGRAHGILVDDSLPLDSIFAFLGRALHFARSYTHAQTEARVDCLTGLFNQRWVMEALGKEIRRAERFSTPLSVLMVDLDELKTVNDIEGHAAGDCLLKHVATRIAGVLRQFDGAARVGGDEFVIILPATDLKGAQQVGRRLLQSFRDDVAHFRDKPLPATAAVGAAEWHSGCDAKQLVELADQAMYAAKRLGPNNLVCQPSAKAKSVRLGPAVPPLPPGTPTAARGSRRSKARQAEPTPPMVVPKPASVAAKSPAGNPSDPKDQ